MCTWILPVPPGHPPHYCGPRIPEHGPTGDQAGERQPTRKTPIKVGEMVKGHFKNQRLGREEMVS